MERPGPALNSSNQREMVVQVPASGEQLPQLLTVSYISCRGSKAPVKLEAAAEVREKENLPGKGRIARPVWVVIARQPRTSLT